uniref:Trs120/TRAPPC9 first Ig-like domain-containing protein n=1 Tax=Ditylenchus dipsaci TaxID=166011 RepID=A0A915DLN1_9BILA
MSAFRAEFFDAAIRHLCFILQNYYDNLDKGVALNMIEELNKMVSLRRDKVHCLAQPIVLDHYEIMLPPLQFTRFPTLSNCKVTALPAHLAPNVIDPADLASKIFIYSPFQDRDKERGVYWVVDCACEVSICVRNPLPIELEVRNLALITEGCKFDAMPVRLNLPSCYGSVLDPASTSTIKLLGVPRSSGLLKLTGYSCEVLGVKNVCAFRDQHQSTPNQSHLSSLSGQPGIFKVERSPTVEDSIEAIAEATVFRVKPSTTLFSCLTRAREFQSNVLLDFPDINELNESARRTFQPEVYDIKPLERREIRIRIFGIDLQPLQLLLDSMANMWGGGHKPFHPPPPTAQPSITSMGEEHRVYVRRATSMSLNEGSVCSLDTIPQSKTEAQQSRSNSPKRLAGIPILSAPALLMAGTGDHGSRKESSVGLLEEEDPAAGHDLIPYTGRLLSADFVFTYTADATGPNGEQYERVAKLPLAIAIVPAVNVSDWHILSGDSPTSRYVVVDVCNLTDMDAELTYGDNRMIWVQPKEICRVPLLCPCCTDIQSSAFASAAQLASHMMQMREIEGLRRTLERHVSRHLDIRWTIPALKLEGSVPVGSLLSSVSFLKQLVIPAMSLSIRVNNAPYVSEDDVAVGIGELVSLQILLLVSLKCKKALNGQLSLRCFQDLQNGLPIIDRSEHLVVCGPSRIPFSIQPTSITTQQPCSDKPEQMGRWETAFNLVFRYEGVHKIRPEITGLGGSTLNLSDEDDIFLPTVSFNVITKVL